MLVKAMMSQYEGATTKVWVGSGLSEEFVVKVGEHQESVMSTILFVTVAEDARED